jgi:hypothetical protein
MLEGEDFAIESNNYHYVKCFYARGWLRQAGYHIAVLQRA